MTGESALRDHLYRLADAGDQAQYLRVLRQMSVRAGDGHITVRPAQPTPRGWTALWLRMMEGKLAVERVLDGSDARQQGIAVGDVVESIDGKPATTVFAEARAEQTGSNDEFRDQRTALFLLSGDSEITVRLGVRGADRKLREVTVARSAANRAALLASSTAPRWRLLAGNVGYVDLRELVVSEVEAMFEALADTTAIVFDMRGYPNGTAWSIAPRINTRKAKYGAQLLIPLVGGRDDEAADARHWFLQKLPELPGGASIYRGKVVVLIDDRAISQAEHSCLFLREAAGATFIGSPTAGANGNVTTMRLPGGLRMSFTGMDVRHADGKQLQKVGIQPDVVVRPTLAGLRAGKDEVLDRALAWLATAR